MIETHDNSMTTLHDSIFFNPSNRHRVNLFRHLLRKHFSITTFWHYRVIVSGVQGYFCIGVFAGFLSIFLRFGAKQGDFLAEINIVYARRMWWFFKSKKCRKGKNRVPDQLNNIFSTSTWEAWSKSPDQLQRKRLKLKLTRAQIWALLNGGVQSKIYFFLRHFLEAFMILPPRIFIGLFFTRIPKIVCCFWLHTLFLGAQNIRFQNRRTRCSHIRFVEPDAHVDEPDAMIHSIP